MPESALRQWFVKRGRSVGCEDSRLAHSFDTRPALTPPGAGVVIGDSAAGTGRRGTELFGCVPSVRDLTLFLSRTQKQSEGVRLPPPKQPIHAFSIHVVALLAAERIAKALAEHNGKVTVFVSRYVMSGGIPIALLPTKS